MAAYASVVTLINIIHDIQHHHSPPVSLHIQQLQSLTQILTSLQDFLETYKSPVADVDESDPLEMRIADAAQDVIESHIVHKITHQQPAELDEQTESITFYQDLQRVINEMDQIKQMATKIDTENVVDVSAPLKYYSSSSSAMVCYESVLLEIMEKLTGSQLDRQVIPIVGMGGIGKTTLASNIFAHPLIKEHFDVCAWATISQKYNTREIFCEILSQTSNKKYKNEVNDKSEDELGSELYKYLFGRRFLIVMDDMWSIDAWDKIQCYFPDNENGSRILVTTRLSQLGSQLNTSYSLQMELLDEVGSWNLFSRTVFGERSSCPRELERIGKSIVHNCRGLPLSIVVVGGILKRMEQTECCWESVRNNLTSLVNLENDKHCLRLLKLSYNHLPEYLKPCFLYMGMFEEDDEIRVSTLIKLWVSERFLKPMNDRSLETIAMGFLKDLIDRNLILIHNLSKIGNIKSCKIHDLLRDLCLNEGQRDGFHHVIGRNSEGINRQCRRVVIPKNTPKEKVVEDLKSIGHARSVICEYGEVPPCPNFGLLTTYHAYKIRHLDGPQNFNSVAFKYVNLRHLSAEVFSNIMSSFFSSLNLLWNLHTLIISCWSEECTAPAEMWKMPQFRYIEFTRCKLCLPDPPKDKDDDDVVIMKNLQTLKGVENFKCCEEVVKRIPNIEKLKIEYNRELEGTNQDQVDFSCLANIKFLSKLESLYIWCDTEVDDIPCLNKLSFPKSLKSILLFMNDEFEWEAVLENISSLPCLEKLKLCNGSFRGGKWEIVEGQFPKLKFLGLCGCDDLRRWTVEGSSALPVLAQLRLFQLNELEEIPREIGDIPTLEKITLLYCKESLVKSAKAMVEEQVELQGEPLSFHVDVTIEDYQGSPISLEDHNFTVSEKIVL